MGWFSSDEQEIESKVVDTTGNVNNNIIIREAADIHSAMVISERLLFATYLLVGFEIVKIGIYAFHSLRKCWKRKYQNTLPK